MPAGLVWSAMTSRTAVGFTTSDAARGVGSWGTAVLLMGDMMRSYVGVLCAVWLAVGAVAAGQRSYFEHPVSCDLAATTLVTAAAGPLNYYGVDPVVTCPQPS